MEMKNLLFISVLLLIPLAGEAAPWVDDWIAQKSVTSPQYFDGQRRGYFSGGSLQARWRMTNDNPLTVMPPKIKAGCGGIDVFLGGLSFLDPDLLVQKFQGIVQAAPAVAFDMALKTMCKECSETMKAMERAASWLNNLQLNDCALTKRVVATVDSDDPDVTGAVLDEISGGVTLNQALDRNFNEHQRAVRGGNGTPPNDMNIAIQDCPAEFLAIFQNGSVLENATTRLGLVGYQDIMRGYIGDVYVEYDNASNSFVVTPIDKCRGNDELSFDDFLTGDAEQRGALPGDACAANSATDLYTWVSNQLTTIATKMTTNAGPYTPAEQAFIDQAPLPVFQILKTAIQTNMVASTTTNLSEPLAVAYAYKVMDDLYMAVDYVVKKSLEAAKKKGVSAGGASERCNTAVLGDAITQVKSWKNELSHLRASAREAYGHRINSFVQHLEMIRAQADLRLAAQKDQLGNLRQ